MKIFQSPDYHFHIKFEELEACVIDLGYNDGSFEREIHQRYNKYLYLGVEANSSFKHAISARILHKLVSNETGEKKRFNINEQNSGASSAIFNDSTNQVDYVETISLIDIYKESKFEFVHLLKVDIEGSEYSIFSKETIQYLSDNTGQILIEFHDWIDARFLPETQLILSTFKSHGFRTIKMSFFTNGSILLVNENFHKLNKLHLLHITLFKYLSGFKRLVKKLLRKFLPGYAL